MRIDLHSHALPAIDDGPRDLDAALALLAAAVADGTGTLACTSHCSEEFPAVRASKVAGRVARLQAAADERGIPIRLVIGGEVDLGWAARAGAEALRLVSYGGTGRDLLVESPFGRLPRDFADRLHALREHGYRLLLAHPERTPEFGSDRDGLAELVEDELVLVQVTAGALCGIDIGWPVSDVARAIVADGLAHVIASDAHHALGPRAPGLAAAEAIAAELTSPEHARAMTTDNPAAILAGNPLPLHSRAPGA